jgi:hypothetical protein
MATPLTKNYIAGAAVLPAQGNALVVTHKFELVLANYEY